MADILFIQKKMTKPLSEPYRQPEWEQADMLLIPAWQQSYHALPACKYTVNMKQIRRTIKQIDIFTGENLQFTKLLFIFAQ